MRSTNERVEIDSTALARALDAFCEAYGHGIVWTSVLPLLQAASTLPVPYVGLDLESSCTCHDTDAGRCRRHA